MLPLSFLRPVVKTPVWVLLLPALAAMVWQVCVSAPGISAQHPYSDVLHYERLASGERDFLGSNHVSYRIVLPLVLTLPPPAFRRPAFGVLLLAALAAVVYYVKSGAGALDMWVLLFGLYTSPAFWRGFFLPIPDALLWILLVLTAIELRRPLPRITNLAGLALIAVLTKEMALLSLLFIPAIIKLPHWRLFSGAFLLAALVYLVLLFAGNAASNTTYVLTPEAWISDWLRSDTHGIPSLFKAFFSGFAGVIAALILRFLLAGKTSLAQVTGTLAAIFFVCWLFAPENSPRLMFPFTGLALLLFPRQKNNDD